MHASSRNTSNILLIQPARVPLPAINQYAVRRELVILHEVDAFEQGHVGRPRRFDCSPRGRRDRERERKQVQILNTNTRTHTNTDTNTDTHTNTNTKNKTDTDTIASCLFFGMIRSEATVVANMKPWTTLDQLRLMICGRRPLAHNVGA